MQKPKLNKRIEDIVRNMPHIVAIHPTKYTELPEVDYSLLKDNYLTRKVIDYIKIYLTEYPLIEDDFALGEGHTERRMWKLSLKKVCESEIRKCIEENKLRGNQLQNQAHMFCYLAHAVKDPAAKNKQK